MRASRHGRHFKKCFTLHIDWKFEHKKLRVLCEVITAFESWNQEKTATFGEKKCCFIKTMHQLVEPGGIAIKRPKTQQSTGEVMASVFWDGHGVIFIDYLEKGQTIIGAYYAALLDRLFDEIRKKRSHLKKKKSFFMMTMYHLTHWILHRQKNMTWVSNASASSVFSRRGPQQLLFVSKPQEMAVW